MYLYNFSNRNAKKINHVLNMLNFYFYHISLIIRNFLILKVANKNRNYREKNAFGGKKLQPLVTGFFAKNGRKIVEILSWYYTNRNTNHYKTDPIFGILKSLIGRKYLNTNRFNPCQEFILKIFHFIFHIKITIFSVFYRLI